MQGFITWCAILVLAISTSMRLEGQEAKATYRIVKSTTSITVDGKLDEPAWQQAKSVGDFVFPWWQDGPKEQTAAKLLWDSNHLYVAFQCEDRFVSGDQTERDARVYQDDCVEVFTSPNPDQPLNYFNIEMNVRGAFLDQHHPDGPGKPVPGQWNAEGVKIATSVQGTLNDDTDQDRGWILEASIPFANYAKVAKHTPPQVNDIWHMNLNRLGGKSNPQYSQWTASKTERPQFHAPQDFGRVIFVDK